MLPERLEAFGVGVSLYQSFKGLVKNYCSLFSCFSLKNQKENQLTNGAVAHARGRAVGIFPTAQLTLISL